jgi:hypothetical protein
MSSFNEPRAEILPKLSNKIALLSKPIFGSSVVGFGGPKPTTDEPEFDVNYPHDIIKYSVKSKETNLAKFKELYEQGLSLRAIARRTGYSKTKVRSFLMKAGIAIRDFAKSHKRTDLRPGAMYSGAIPYGYCYLEGKLVVDPREYQIVLEIYYKWQNGKSLRAIARDLNDRKVATRFGKSWKHEVIKKIIERHAVRLNENKS